MRRFSSPKFLAAIILVSVISLGLVTGTAAQIIPSIVTIIEVQSQNFPQVTAYVAVTDANGPIDGLTAEPIGVFEDGLEVSNGTVNVEAATLENLRLVLALDTSVLESELTQIQTAAKSMVDTLSPNPRDRIAIISFGDTVDVVRDFTNNGDELKKAIDSLTPIGEFTALHQMLSEATALVEASGPGRKAIIVITNARNNTGTLSAEESVAQAQTLKIPVYVIGFGNRVQTAQPLAEPVATTGGQYVTLPTANQIATALPEAVASIRAGYKISFRSDLEADEQTHDLKIVVSGEGGQAAEAEGQFEAIPGTVSVTLPGFSEGQVVIGDVELIPEITTPASVASVEYLVDGEFLTNVTTAPYNLKWDSGTVAEGRHTLTIDVTDSAANKGQFEITLDVRPSLSISVSTSAEQYEIGQPVPIEANVQATAELAQIELLVNGVSIESKTTGPYRFSFDSASYKPGIYQITLLAEDTAGQVSEDSVTLELLPKTVPLGWFERFTTHPWVRFSGLIIVALVAVAAVLLLILILLRILDRWHRRRSRQTRQLEIFNMGNIGSYYELKAKEPAQDLIFQFAVGGQRLFEQIIYRDAPVESVYSAGAIVPVADPLKTGRIAASPPPPPRQSSAPSGSQGRVGQTLNKAGQAQYKTQGCIYTIAELLDTIAIFLPGAVGNAVRGWSNQLYSGQMAVDQATRTPEQMARTAGHLKSQVSSVVPTQTGGVTTGRSLPPGGVADTTPLEPTTVVPPVKSQVMKSQGVVVGKNQRYEIDRWSQTPLIDPEKNILIDLQITPENPYKKRSYNFTVVSKSADEDAATAMHQQGSIDIPGVPWFLRYIPPVTMILTGFVFVSGVILLTLWRLDQMGFLN